MEHGKLIRNKRARTRFLTNTFVTRNFYPTQTPLDLQFEEREMIVRNAYNPKSLYKWNIDGLLQYEISDELLEMLMVSNVYKDNNKTDHQIVNIIVTGFTGQLKVWQDNTLKEIDRQWLTSGYKRAQNGKIIPNEKG